MKRFLKPSIVAVVLCLISPNPVLGQLDTADEISGEQRVALAKKKSRPLDVSGTEAGVSCVYINGYITVEFAQPEGRGRIKVTCVDSGESVSNWFYTITPYSIYVGDAPGVYQIDITTSQNSYEGTLIL